MAGNDFLCGREPNARPALLGAEEWVEDLLPQLARDPGTRVGDSDDEFLARNIVYRGCPIDLHTNRLVHRRSNEMGQTQAESFRAPPIVAIHCLQSV